MGRVTSIGTKVRSGEYRQLYSAHHKVRNFLAGEMLLSVCSRDICAGVYRIVLDRDDVEGIESVEVAEGKLYVNGKAYCFGAGEVYHAPVLDEIRDYPLLIHNLNGAEAMMMEQYTKGSIPSLLIEGALPNTVDGALLRYYREGLRLLFAGDYPAAVRCFRHRGIGLSPAGDDFLVGLVLGMMWVQQTQKKELSKIVDTIIHESDVNNPLIRTFMMQAKELDLDADWARFLSSLAQHGGSYLAEMQEIMKHGASSGADQLSGFFVACELFCSGMEQRIRKTVKKE